MLALLNAAVQIWRPSLSNHGKRGHILVVVLGRTLDSNYTHLVLVLRVRHLADVGSRRAWSGNNISLASSTPTPQPTTATLPGSGVIKKTPTKLSRSNTPKDAKDSTKGAARTTSSAAQTSRAIDPLSQVCSRILLPLIACRGSHVSRCSGRARCRLSFSCPQTRQVQLSLSGDLCVGRHPSSTRSLSPTFLSTWMRTQC